MRTVGLLLLAMLTASFSSAHALTLTSHFTTGSGLTAEELKSDQQWGQLFEIDTFDSITEISIDSVALYLYRQNMQNGKTITASIRSSWNGPILWESTIAANDVERDNSANQSTIHDVVNFAAPAATFLTETEYYLRVDTTSNEKVYIHYDEASSYSPGSLVNKDGVEEGSSKDLLFGIEGSYAVPEPSTALLFGLGLACWANVCGRRVKLMRLSVSVMLLLVVSLPTYAAVIQHTDTFDDLSDTPPDATWTVTGDPLHNGSGQLVFDEYYDAPARIQRTFGAGDFVADLSFSSVDFGIGGAYPKVIYHIVDFPDEFQVKLYETSPQTHPQDIRLNVKSKIDGVWQGDVNQVVGKLEDGFTWDLQVAYEEATKKYTVNSSTNGDPDIVVESPAFYASTVDRYEYIHLLAGTDPLALLDSYSMVSEPATLEGDFNMDGVIDSLDLGILLGNFGTTGTPETGELNGTAPVDSLDLGILLGSFGASPLAATAVPEPSTLVSLAGAILCGLAVRRRQPYGS
ncbi:MAG: PEP-CTERM sorting domain-containing protein [Pirellulales bacterium]|nr:PEP-CTERM sorting domain-containing protein [Pirellulales bacterium]